MSETLSPADRSSLAAEIGTVNMAVGGLLVFDDGPGLAYDAVLARVADRLHLVPRYRQRLHRTAAGLANPVWIDDDGFDLAWHVRPATLPAPADDAALAALVGREMSRRLGSLAVRAGRASSCTARTCRSTRWARCSPASPSTGR